jgi:hypothetical protein
MHDNNTLMLESGHDLADLDSYSCVASSPCQPSHRLARNQNEPNPTRPLVFKGLQFRN